MAKDALNEVEADSGSWTATVIDLFSGVIPCSPISPSVAVTVDALEFYRIAHLWNPHFSRQAYAKTLCDLHGVEYRCYLSRQLTIAFDLYLQVRRSVDALVAEVLNRNTPDWCLKHACPSCTYTLADEEHLTFKLLYAMDGNDSLNWGNGRQEEPNTTIGTDDTENPCAGQWKNMDDEKTKQMWGVYDETGIFIAVCRHGFSLVIADMLLDTFGSNLGGRYDIGCQFKTTLANSSLGSRAQSLYYTSLVSAFHGHAHKWLCQLDHLTMYVPGLGLEDLETCERTFSKSNALASTMRYASIFHCQQGITCYFEHNDDYEVYANLYFRYHNYKQALDIICDSRITLPKLMQDINVTKESTFDVWLKEEKVYLQGLCTEPELKTLQMEYWQKLVNLSTSKNELDTASSLWAMSTPSNAHSLASNENADWQNAGCLVANQKYQRSLDQLEGLIVARIFELTKMNRSGTGYKMRKHIAKALQTRSTAIRNALDRYNAAVRALSPPHRMLKWEEVVEYAFLADFDLLRDSRSDISQWQWATPAARQATDLYFKCCRAKEEITRLDVEVRRLATYIRDEDHYLHECQQQAEAFSPALAHQISLRQQARGRFNFHHIKRLQDIARLPGFSGTIVPGDLNPLATESADDLDDEEEELMNMEEASEVLQNVLCITMDS
ncbi:hypothetical protein BDR05DRAFT_978821 [Suillus weaverae]|nr:hypothetical protein BDR05DRAFT_978821 [Suillus weaverae]